MCMYILIKYLTIYCLIFATSKLGIIKCVLYKQFNEYINYTFG